MNRPSSATSRCCVVVAITAEQLECLDAAFTGGTR